MKRIFFYITVLILFILTSIIPSFAENEALKVLSINYDDSSSLVYISTRDGGNNNKDAVLTKCVRLSNPNRIYFDINNAVLLGEKQHIIFEKSPIKEMKLAQFSTEPNTVRVVITFEEDFDSSKVKVLYSSGNVIVTLDKLELKNNYFNISYDENNSIAQYSNITASSQVIQKTQVPVNNASNSQNSVMEDIQKAFANSTLANSNGTTYDSVVSLDLSSALKLRTKYFINQYITKNKGLLVSGLGQITTNRIFYLDNPKRCVIDLPNAYLDRPVRNKSINLCPDGSCKDTAKIGQFDTTTARIVVTSDKAEKYLPIYSNDAQSLFLVDSDKLTHTSLVANVSNLNKAYVKKIDSKTNELILSFTSPIVYSIVRKDDSLSLFLFNVKSYNEPDLIKTFANTSFKNFTFSLLPQIGIKSVLNNLKKEDVVKIEQSVDSKALKITLVKSDSQIKVDENIKPTIIKALRGKTKNKVVLDAGHGGTDYGAIREGINEKDINLDVTRRVESILKSKGYKVALTRKDDTYVSLEDRVDISEKEEPEIFVSIHVNSAVSTDPYGIETHYYHDYSKSLAEVVHKHLAKEIDTKDRGLFKSKFYVINHTTDPAILVEIGFISNEAERQELVTDARKQKTAKAIAEGIMEYLKANGKK